MYSVGMSWKEASSMKVVVNGPWLMACHHFAIGACDCFLFRSSFDCFVLTM